MASKYLRPAIVFTAILTQVQAIAWFIMSLLGVLAYRCELGIPESDDSNGEQFGLLLYHLYFQGPNCMANFTIPGAPYENLKDSLYANPELINGWMATYLALNITYMLIAIGLFVGLCRTANGGDFSRTLIRLWCANTLAFLIMDFWLTIIWGVDFQNINIFLKNHVFELNGTFGWSASVPGALMAITARGFILYIINLALFCYFIRYTANWSALFTNCSQSNNGSQQQLSKTYTGNEIVPYQPNLPRVNPDSWDHRQLAVRHNMQRPLYHPNAVEGVTVFDDWYGTPQRQPARHQMFEDPQAEVRTAGIRRAPSPPRRGFEDVFNGNPTVRSAFEYPDRRNFQQGGERSQKAKSVGRHNADFY